MKPETTFSANFRAAMRDKGMRQQDVSNQTGIDKSVISRYCTGSYLPKYQHLTKIADALGVDPEELTGEPKKVPSMSGNPRLWHIDLLSYLPDSLFRQQEKDLLDIMRAVRDGGMMGNPVVDYVRAQPRTELYSYFLEYAFCYAERYGKLIDNHEEWVSFSDRTYIRRPFSKWHALEELRLCMAILLERCVYGYGETAITNEEWCTLLDGYRKITGADYCV